MPKTTPLYNLFYFQSLLQQMERSNTYMIIDGSGILWHKNDLVPIIEQYQPREVVNNS